MSNALSGGAPVGLPWWTATNAPSGLVHNFYGLNREPSACIGVRAGMRAHPSTWARGPRDRRAHDGGVRHRRRRERGRSRGGGAGSDGSWSCVADWSATVTGNAPTPRPRNAFRPAGPAQRCRRCHGRAGRVFIVRPHVRTCWCSVADKGVRARGRGVLTSIRQCARAAVVGAPTDFQGV